LQPVHACRWHALVTPADPLHATDFR
jgi:hypothetical protein